jgi:hypothetical protein
MMVVKKVATLVVLFFLGLGVFFVGSKFNVPWYGSNDFKHYGPMVEAPLSAESKAPWGYRVLTPAVAHVIWQSGFYYQPGRTPFKEAFTEYEGRNHRASVLGALIFTNFLFLVLAAFFLVETFKIGQKAPDDMQSSLTRILLASSLFLAFSTAVFGMAGLTEGGTLLFICLLAYLHRSGNFEWFVLVMLLSIAQRELISVVMAVYLLAQGWRINTRYWFVSALAFAGYMLVRELFPLPGNEAQVQLSAQLLQLASFSLTREFLLQGILSNNIVWGLLLLVLLYRRQSIKHFMPYFSVVAVLLALGVGSGIGPNVGRIINMALPLFLLAIHDVLSQSSSPSPPVGSVERSAES